MATLGSKVEADNLAGFKVFVLIIVVDNMLKRLCIYNNKLFIALDCYLSVYRYNKFPKSEDEKFFECFKIKLPMKYTSIFDTKFHIVNNYATGLKSLLIFTFDSNGDCTIFIYNDTFRPKLYQINLPIISLGIKSDLFASNGPSFLLQSKNVFHMYSYCEKRYSDFTIPFTDYKEFKVLQFRCIGPFGSCQQYLYLLIISCNFSNQQSLKLLGFISDMKNTITSFKQLTMNSFFPQCYEISLRAIEITKAIPHLKADLININNIEWNETASVICTENECLIFSNADLQYCCKLTIPLTNVMRMETDFMNTFSDKINLILTLENKCVFFIEMNQNMNLEVIKQLSDIEETIIGDILMKGSQQVLLLKQADLNLWQNNIILYDMSSFVPINVLSQSSVPDNCLKSTISGLERRVQIGKSAIRDIEFEISQKSAATVDALIKLNEYKVNAESLKSSYTFQQSLVDLILSKDENQTETIVPKSESSLKLLEEKHRFVDNQWIISLCFINETERCICYPSIKVLKRNTQVACIQKLFICNSDDSFFASEYSKEINMNSKFYIVLTLKNLVFQTEEDIFMVLIWYDGSTDAFDNELFVSEDKKILTQNQICIQTRIIFSDILQQHTRKGISCLTDLLFLRPLQQKINLCILSLHSDISKLEDILMKNDSTLNCLHLLENSSTKCIVFNSDSSPLFGIHFIIIKTTPNVVEITAFTKSGNEVCLLVHYLYQHLSKDVVISPCLKFKDDYTETKKKLIVSMKNEVDLLISSFNAHNISEEMKKSYIKLVSSQTVGTLTIPKINYQRIRSVLVKKECMTDILFKSISQDADLF